MTNPIIPRYTANTVPESFFSVRRLDDALGVAAGILAAVRERGDTAVRHYASQFDRANPARLEVSPDDVRAAEETLKNEKLNTEYSSWLTEKQNEYSIYNSLTQ